jgi:hypothetical protein
MPVNTELFRRVFFTAFQITMVSAVSAVAATLTVTNVNDSGTGSLRQAILSANSAAGADTIVFDTSFNLPRIITLTGTGLAINDVGNGPLTITGPGPGLLTISGNNVVRVFAIAPLDTATISGVTITLGNGTTGASPGFGGCVFNDGNLTLTNTIISDCRATGDGGGIFVNGLGGNDTLTLNNTQVRNNIANSDNGGFGSGGGVFANFGTSVSVLDSTISGNDILGVNDPGGGVCSFGATVVITRSTFSGNSSQDAGGAFFSGGSATIADSTFGPNNSATADGGAVWADAPLTITNTTISGNTAGRNGGGIYETGGSTVSLQNSTVVNNTAGAQGGGIRTDTPTFNLRSSLIGNNSAPNGSDLNGTFNSQNFNLIENPAGATFTGGTANNIIGQDPNVGPLQNNGGPTFTTALITGSPAIDKGFSFGLTTDQRGLPRVVDFPAITNPPGCDGTDIGAFEVQAPVACIPLSQFAPAIVTGTDAGADAVKRFDVTVTERASYNAFSPNFVGGVRVALGDVTGDGSDDIVVGAGPGGAPQVKVFDGGCTTALQSFFAFSPSFTGGIYVATGDVNGDGNADIITGTGAGTTAHVRVFDSTTQAEIRSFFPFGSFTGGVRVASADVSGDGLADIITGAGPGGAPQVKVFDGVSSGLLHDFLAYPPAFGGGVFVAGGDINNDGRADVITGAGTGGGPHVKVFSGANAELLQSFFAFDSTFVGGVHVAAGRINGDEVPDILVGSRSAAGPVTDGDENMPDGTGGTARVRAFDGANNTMIRDFTPYPASFAGGVFVAAPATRTATISGRVTTPSGLGLRNAVVALTDSQGVRRTATTSSFGNYSFVNVRPGENYVIGVSSKRYRFAARSMLINDSLTNVDFVGLE